MSTQQSTIPPDVLVARIAQLQQKYPQLDMREILRLAFMKQDFALVPLGDVVDFEEDAYIPSAFQLGKQTPLEKRLETLKQYTEARKSPTGQLIGAEAFHIEPPESITVPFSVMNTETGAIVQGEVVEGLLDQTIQMTPVSSSNVMASGMFQNELLVQFLPKGNTPLRTYRYKFESPEVAKKAHLSLINSGSPGRWIWQNIRGHVGGTPVEPYSKAPSLSPPGKGNLTIGGTTASLVPYSISNRTPVGRVKGFGKMTQLLQRTTSNPTLIQPQAEAEKQFVGRLQSRGALRSLGIKGFRTGSGVMGLPKLDFILKPIGNVAEDIKKEISWEEAIQMFEQRSDRAKASDRRQMAKKVYDKPTESWMKRPNYSDVVGIDTPKTKTKSGRYRELLIQHKQLNKQIKELEEDPLLLHTEQIKQLEKERNEIFDEIFPLKPMPLKRILFEIENYEGTVDYYKKEVKRLENDVKRQEKGIDSQKEKDWIEKEMFLNRLEQTKNMLKQAQKSVQYYSQELEREQEHLKKYEVFQSEIVLKPEDLKKFKFDIPLDPKFRIAKSLLLNVENRPELERAINIINTTYNELPKLFKKSTHEIRIFDKANEDPLYSDPLNTSLGGFYNSHEGTITLGIANESKLFKYSVGQWEWKNVVSLKSSDVVWLREITVHETAHAFDEEAFDSDVKEDIKLLYEQNKATLEKEKRYAAKNATEFFAECYANAFLGQLDFFKTLTPRVLQTFEYLLRRYDFVDPFEIIKDLETIKYSYTQDDGIHVFGKAKIPEDISRKDAEKLIEEGKAEYLVLEVKKRATDFVEVDGTRKK